jgi:hypothetical protein
MNQVVITITESTHGGVIISTDVTGQENSVAVQVAQRMLMPLPWNHATPQPSAPETKQ